MNDFRKLAHLKEQLGDERFQVLIISDNTGKVKAFCDGLLRDSVSTTVESLFKKLLSSCNQDWVNNDITEEHFPLVDDGTGDKEILEYGFDRTVTGLQAEKELKKLGYKFIGIKRAMEYVASHPDAQKAHPLIVLGARWYRGSCVRVPCFGWDGGRRCFNLYWIDDEFSDDCRFLVVRE